MKKQEMMVDELLEYVTLENLKEMVIEVNGIDDSLDWLDVVDNEEYTINSLFDKPYEALRSAFYGDYRPHDDYIRFNGYGNLESISSYDYDEELIKYKKEIVTEYVRLVNENEIENDIIEIPECEE